MCSKQGINVTNWISPGQSDDGYGYGFRVEMERETCDSDGESE